MKLPPAGVGRESSEGKNDLIIELVFKILILLFSDEDEDEEDEDNDDDDDDDDEEDAEVEEVVEKIPPPPGVTVRDVELFKKVQQTTAEVNCLSINAF